MRKWMAFVVWILVLSLVGCRASDMGNTQPSNTTDPTRAPTQASTEDTQTEPTQNMDERITALMYDYNEIVGKLDLYTYGGVIQISTGDRSQDFSGNEAMAYAFHKLTELEEIDPWLNEADWAERVYPGYYPNFDRQSYLDRFTVLEDVLLRVEYASYHENGNNITRQTDWVVYNYNPDGTVCYIENGVWHLDEFYIYSHITHADMFYCYDENGELLKMYFGAPDDYRLTLTQTYDAAGRLTAEHFAKEEVTHRIEYTYDEAGRLIQTVLYENVNWDPDLSLRYVTDYAYDDSGRLIWEEERYMNYDSNGEPAYINHGRTLEYSYDDGGKLASTVLTGCVYTLVDSDTHEVELFSTSVSNIRYAYDEAGRLVTRTVVELPTVYADGPDPTMEEVTLVETYVYGDCYLFDQLVVEP